VSVLLGNGDGTFQSQVTYPAGNNLSDLVAGDFDHDGHLDLAVLAYNTNSVNILKGNGDGTFQAPVLFGVDYGPEDLATGDFNGDGQTDIVTANYYGTPSLGFTGSISVLINDTFPTTAFVVGNVQSGNLTEHLYNNPAFAVTLDGRDEVVSYQIPLEVNDARGSGAGWNLTITSTQFYSGGHTLATNASVMTGVTAGCVFGASCVPSTNSVAYPLTVPAGAVAPPPVKWFNAAALSGMGAVNVTPTINVSIPASTFAGSYYSVVTLAVVSGP
jgi:hypothetical protein